jgi:hypothetical protein
MVLLPHSRDFGSRVTFTDFWIKPDFPVLVDTLLVFHPDYPRLYLKRIKDFSDEKYFLLVAKSNDSYLKGLLNDSRLLKYVSSGELSMYFTFISNEERITEDYTVHINFDCSTSPSSFDVRITQHLLDKYDGNPQTLIKFPGCNKDRGVISYMVPTKMLLSTDPVIYEFSKFDISVIKDFKIYKGSQEQKLIYLKDPSLDPIIYKSYPIRNSDLVVYSFDLNKPIKIERNSDTINISSTINKLLLGKQLKSPITVWTPKGNVVIKNELNE